MNFVCAAGRMDLCCRQDGLNVQVLFKVVLGRRENFFIIFFIKQFLFGLIGACSKIVGLIDASLFLFSNQISLNLHVQILFKILSRGT